MFRQVSMVEVSSYSCGGTSAFIRMRASWPSGTTHLYDCVAPGCPELRNRTNAAFQLHGALNEGLPLSGPLAQRPFQTGARFSEKARAPSSWSSLP